jgi:hypothetical protein
MKMAETKRTFVERRKGPDIVVKAVWWVVGISWLLIITALIFTDQAKPERTTFFDRLFEVSVRKHWDRDLLQNAFYVLLVNLAVCIIGFIMNMMRQKRKTDKISKSIIVLTTITLAGILWYVFS